MGTTAQFKAVGNSSPRRTVAKLLCDPTEIGQAVGRVLPGLRDGM